MDVCSKDKISKITVLQTFLLEVKLNKMFPALSCSSPHPACMPPCLFVRVLDYSAEGPTLVRNLSAKMCEEGFVQLLNTDHFSSLLHLGEWQTCVLAQTKD